MVPACSTMNNRREPSPACTTITGFVRPDMMGTSLMAATSGDEIDSVRNSARTERRRNEGMANDIVATPARFKRRRQPPSRCPMG